MSLDFLTLKMVVVSPSEHERGVLRQAAGLASVPIDVLNAINTLGVLRGLERGEIDIAFIGPDIAEADRMALLRAAHSEKPAGKDAPLVIFIEEPTVRETPDLIGWADDSDAVRPDGLFRKPFTIEQARAFVDRCVRARLPSRVLVVDDSSVVRKVVTKVLQASRFRHEIHDVSEGAAALQMVRSGTFDVVFLDCNMPGLDGWATLAEIRRDHPTVAVVMMTGAVDKSLPDRARVAGATGFLFKPFFPRDINNVLNTIYGLSAPVSAAA